MMKPARDLTNNLRFLLSRGFLTPNYLTSRLMYVLVLSKMADNRVAEATVTVEDIPLEIQEIKNDSDEYVIYFPGTNSDALVTAERNARQLGDDKNYLFLNYPDVYGSEGTSNHTDELVDTCAKLVKKQLETHKIPHHKMTLYGFSLGGGVATAVATKLHDEGIPVNLTVNKSFSAPSAVLPTLLLYYVKNYTALRNLVGIFSDEKSDETYEVPELSSWSPMITTTYAFTIGSLIPGLVLSELLNTIGLLLACGIDYFSPCLAQAVYVAINAVSSVIGALFMLASLVLGIGVGLALGGCLQLAKTDFPIEPISSALLDTTIGNLDSAAGIKKILSYENHGEIIVANSKSDEVIRPEAALNTGLGLPADANRVIDKSNFKTGKFTSFWHEHTDHCGPLNANDIDLELIFHKP